MGSGAFGLVWTTAIAKHSGKGSSVPPPKKLCRLIILNTL